MKHIILLGDLVFDNAAYVGRDPMSLRPCRECNAEVSTEAETCPHCGVRNPTGDALRPAKGKSGQGCFIVLLVVIGIIVIASITGKQAKSPEKLAQEKKRDADFSADYDRLTTAGALAVATRDVEKFEISGWNSSLDLYIANRSEIKAASLADFFCSQFFKQPLKLAWKTRIYLADNTVGAQCNIR